MRARYLVLLSKPCCGRGWLTDANIPLAFVTLLFCANLMDVTGISKREERLWATVFVASQASKPIVEARDVADKACSIYRKRWFSLEMRMDRAIRSLSRGALAGWACNPDQAPIPTHLSVAIDIWASIFAHEIVKSRSLSSADKLAWEALEIYCARLGVDPETIALRPRYRRKQGET